jgi:hypothetical protein
MRIEYPKSFHGAAVLNKKLVYFFHEDRILFFSQENFEDHNIIARLKLKSWKQPQ